MQEGDVLLWNVSHGHEGHPNGQEAAIEITELQHADLHQTETILIFTRVAGVIEDGEEHGKEVDDAFGVVISTKSHVDTRNEEQVAQGEQQRSHQNGYTRWHLRIFGAVPATISLHTDTRGEHKAAGHVMVTATKASTASRNTWTGRDGEDYRCIAVIHREMLLRCRLVVYLEATRHLLIVGRALEVHHALLHPQRLRLVHVRQALA